MKVERSKLTCLTWCGKHAFKKTSRVKFNESLLSSNFKYSQQHSRKNHDDSLAESLPTCRLYYYEMLNRMKYRRFQNLATRILTHAAKFLVQIQLEVYTARFPKSPGAQLTKETTKCSGSRFSIARSRLYRFLIARTLIE